LELAAFHPKIAVAYTKIATISTDAHHESQEFRASVGAVWPFLSDPDRIVQRDLDIQEYTDPEHDPMIPHTLVLKPGLVIHSIYNGYWFWGRPSLDELRRDLREASIEIRPDFDLGAPGLREKWEAGDFAPFHGWSKWSPARREEAR
jgi:peroxiredoxin